MEKTESLFGLLRQATDPDVTTAIETLVRDGTDRDLNRVNVPAFAMRYGLDEELAINGFLHASVLGLFEMSWNVLCPGCGGVLDTSASLRTLVRTEYACALCAANYAPTLDDLIEVTFTVSPRVRRISGHRPHELPFVDYLRMMYWGSWVDVTEESFEKLVNEAMLDTMEMLPGERAVMSLTLPEGYVIVFEPVTHAVQFIPVSGEPVRERQALTVIYDRDHHHTAEIPLRPGPLRLSLENRTDTRTLPTVIIAGDVLHDFLGARRPYLTGKRLLSNQTFRDLFRTNTLDIDQRLKITSLTFLFTDLRGSTELYERVGDLAAFDLVQAHFQVLQGIVTAEAGAVVKTIGDAVMATFATPGRAIAAAMRMREAMRDLNARAGRDDLLLKIGLHEGPCIAVTLNERQDYFGQTVNIAARVQGLADAQSIFVTNTVVDDTQTAKLLADLHLTPILQDVSLRGIARDIPVYAVG
jgi:class 3 adenylate cyclase